jgi:uncharacterized membrane protein
VQAVHVLMTTNARDYRLSSIDMLRGLAIAIMAIDHVRDFFMVGGEIDPMANPEIGAALFFTRWITHFCAPVFVFLAGTSAGLMTARRSRASLGAFLFTRGVWLILIECVVIALAWSFAPLGVAQAGGAIVIPLGVIWAIGASMIVLAGAQWLGPRACLVIGAAMILGHNVLDPIWPVTTGVFDVGQPLAVGLHAQMAIVVGPVLIGIVYPLVPWPGVMLLGFGSAAVFQDAPERRDARLLGWGATATATFVVLRLWGVYGDPNPWRMQPTALGTVIDVLNVTKYPPSLLFLLMTLGPAAMVCAAVGRVPDVVRRRLVTFGRVPFAFYVAHLYVAHALAVAFGVSQGFDASRFLTFSFFFPKGYGVGLGGVYTVWLIVIVMLYPFCRWVAAVKARRQDWWLSYL